MKRIHTGRLVAICLAACVVSFAANRANCFADTPDETRAKVLEQLHTFEIPTKGWDKGPYRAKIGIAQAELGDLAAARETLQRILAVVPKELSYLDLELSAKLAAAEAAAGDMDAAKRILLSIFEDSESHYYCNYLLDCALAAEKNGYKKSSRTAVAAVAATVREMKGKYDKQRVLYKLATTQIAVGMVKEAIGTMKQLVALTGQVGEKDAYRMYFLVDLGSLSARLMDHATSRMCFGEALAAAKAASRDISDAKEQIALAMAEAGDVAAALETALSIPETGWDVFSRDGALRSIAQVQLRNGDIAGAGETARKIRHLSQRRNEAVLDILEVYIRNGNTAKAIEQAQTIEKQSHSAQAHLTIAAILAERGDNAQAQKMADGISNPVFGFPFRRGATFAMSDPKTWGRLYDLGIGFTMASCRVAQDTAGDLTAAAMRCRVALRGKGDIEYSEELEQWDARKAARAQAKAGDAAGALIWVRQLKTENRIEGLWGIAEGLGTQIKNANPR